MRDVSGMMLSHRLWRNQGIQRGFMNLLPFWNRGYDTSKSIIFNAASYLKGKRSEILEGDKSKQPMILSRLDPQNYNVIKTVKYSTITPRIPY